MSISGHLKDLRKRVLFALLGITVGAVGGWFLYEPVMGYITAPLFDIQDAGTQINFPTIGAALDLKLRVAIWIGLIISSPWWIYQLGAFIIPGLKRKERLYVFAFGAVGVLLFAGGATTGVWLVPRAVEILQSFVPVGGVSLLQADTYVDFYLRLVILFGISFLIPEVLVALNFLGVLGSRAMLRSWRWAVLVAFIFAAIANPLPSPWPMIMQALILVALYLVAVLISWINERYRKYGRRLRPAAKSQDGGEGAAAGGGAPMDGGSPSGGGAPVGGGQPMGSGSPYAAQMTGPSPASPMPENGFAGVANGAVPPRVDGMPAAPAFDAPSPHAVPVPAGVPTAAAAGPVVGPSSTLETEPVPPADSSSTSGASRICGVIILAGGTAKRMGGISKPDVMVGGMTLLARAVDEIRVVAPAARIVVVAPPEVAIPQGCVRVLEEPPFGGPVAGVASGFAKMVTLTGYRPGGLVGLLTCDAPLAPRLYPALERAFRDATRESMRVANGTDGEPEQFVGGAVPLVSTEAEADGGKPAVFNQYLHGVYVAGALDQLFGAQVRDRSVRSLFSQLELATVRDTERTGMDVDTWEDAAAMEQRLASIDSPWQRTRRTAARPE